MFEKLSKEFKEKLKIIYSLEELNIIEDAYLNKKKNIYFRVNTLKSNNEEIEKILDQKNINFQKISFLTNGYKLINIKEKDIWKENFFLEGKIYLQSISSQLVGEILKDDLINCNLKVLDLASAPGGKTSHISALMKNNGEIIANELNKIRFDKLKFTINRQGCKNVNLSFGDAKNLKNIFSQEYFDLIIADLPCSAEGRIDLNIEKTYLYLNNHGINKKNYLIQKNILENTIGLLKVGGIFIYSTCTLDPLENEGIVHFLLSNYKNLKVENISNFFEKPEINKFTKKGLKGYNKYIFSNEISNSIRIIPSQETEGFFIVKLKKIRT